MRALAIEELFHVGGGDRGWADDLSLFVQDWGSTSGTSGESVTITGRRDGAGMSVTDAMTIGSLIVGGFAAYSVFSAGSAIAIGDAIAVGALLGGAVGIATIVVTATLIYIYTEAQTSQGGGDPFVNMP